MRKFKLCEKYYQSVDSQDRKRPEVEKVKE